MPVRLTQKLLDARLAGRDQHVLAKGVQLPVLRELESAVVTFGGFREDFDDEGWIEDRVALVVGKFCLAADYHDIGIGVQACGGDSKSHIDWGDGARPLPERLV